MGFIRAYGPAYGKAKAKIAAGDLWKGRLSRMIRDTIRQLEFLLGKRAGLSGYVGACF